MPKNIKIYLNKIKSLLPYFILFLDKDKGNTYLNNHMLYYNRYKT